MINLLHDKIMNAFHVERIKREIQLKMLFYRIPSGEEENLIGKIKFTSARLLPKTQQAKTSQITQIVCDGSVYITLWIHPIYTIVIENDIIAKEYVDFYTILWNYSKEIVS